MSKKRLLPCIYLILQQNCCLCSKSCCWMIRSCCYFSKVVSELSVFLTSWILVRGDLVLKVQFQFGAEPGQQKSEAAGSSASLTHSIVIMAFALIDFDVTINYSVNKSVRIVNASAPIAWQVFLQWLWLANPFKWTSANVLQQGIYPFQCFSVLSLPWQVFFKRLFRECDVSPHRQAAPTRP